MKHSCIIIIMCFLFNVGLQAQNEYVKPRKLLMDGIEYHDKGEYSKAIEAYEKINRNDSLYHSALYERALTYNAMEKYDKAVNVLYELLAETEDTTSQMIIALASALDDLEKYSEAQALYLQVVEKQPYNQNAWYNLGVSYYKDKKYLKAEECFIRSIKLKPWHFRSNLILGLTNAKMGRPVHALACLNMAALINAGDQFGHLALQEYEKFTHGEYDEEVEADKYPTPDSLTNDKIRALEPIIKSQVLQSKKIKMPSKNPMTITKYNYVIFSELSANREGNNLYTAYYFPFLRSILDKGYFDVYSYFITSSVNNKSIIKYTATKKAKLNAFSDWMIKELQKYFSSPVFRPNNVDYAYSDGNLIRITTYKDSTKTVKEGKYIEIGTSGDVEFEGYYKDDKEDGLFRSYSENGKVRTFVKYTGKDEFVFTSNPDVVKGNQFEVEMKNGKRHGSYKMMYPNGALKSIQYYKDDEFTGRGFELYMNGDTMTVYKPEADGKHFTTTNYYRNGAVSSKYTKLIGTDAYDGDYVSWFYNGKLARKITLKNDMIIGKTLRMYSNGDTSMVENYDDKGNPTGIQSSFGSSGRLVSQINYVRGKNNYTFSALHRNGKVLSELKVTNDKFNTLVYYDSTGKEVLRHDNLNKNLNEYTNINVFTNVIIDHFFLKDGLREGAARHYTQSGTLFSDSKYSKDKIDGANTVYYPNGQKKGEYYFKEGIQQGKSVSYYPDGKIEAEGFYLDDEKVGEWRYYNADGKLSDVEYINTSGELNGKQYEYCGDTIPVSITTYREGDLIEYLKLGPNRDTMEYYSLPNGYLKQTDYFKNGKIKAVTTYENHVLHDSAIVYFPNGKVSHKMFYIDGYRHGKYMEYNANGSLKREIDFEYGKKNNEYVSYLENGLIDSRFISRNDEDNGPAVYYHYNGKPTAIVNYSEDVKNGFADYFEPGGQLMYRISFEDDEAVSVTWKGKNNEFVEPVLINKDTVKVTTYYASGSKSAELIYVGGNRHGVQTNYFPNGKVFEIRPFVHDLLSGKEISYRENGNIFTETDYLDGTKNGVCVIYNANGTPSVKTEYYFGVRHGIQIYYNEKGQIIQEYHFYADRMLE